MPTNTSLLFYTRFFCSLPLLTLLHISITNNLKTGAKVEEAAWIKNGGRFPRVLGPEETAAFLAFCLRSHEEEMSTGARSECQGAQLERGQIRREAHTHTHTRLIKKECASA